MEKTDDFNQEMLNFFDAEAGAYTYLAISEVNKGSYNVKAQIRDLMVKYLGKENIPRVNVTECQTITFGFYNYLTKKIEKTEKVECKFSKPEPKKEMSIYFTQKMLADFNVSANDIWYVFFSPKYKYPLLGMMPLYEWMRMFSEDRSLFSMNHLNSMYMESVHLHNFRCFQNVEVKLNQDYTVLVGVNGAGKTSILDAIVVAISGYLSGFDGVDTKRISKDDVRLKAIMVGSRANSEPIYPCGVETTAVIDGYKTSWKSLLNSENGNASSTGNETVKTLAAMMQAELKNESKTVQLPIIAYYGTDRLRNISNTKKSAIKDVKLRRLNGYARGFSSSIDFQAFSEWFMDMTYLSLQQGKAIPELEVVRTAMQECYRILTDNQGKCSVSYNLKFGEIEVTLENDRSIEKVSLKLLSDGMKSVLGMVGDIAFRMALLNPHLAGEILNQTAGIILIDEIDLHLHPAWQKNIIKAITSVFPKIQLITTTHAPSILSNVKNNHLLILDDNQIYNYSDSLYGKDIESILHEIMDTEPRPKEVIDLIAAFNDWLDKEQLDKAEEILNKLEEILGPRSNDVVAGSVSLSVEREYQSDDID